MIKLWRAENKMKINNNKNHVDKVWWLNGRPVSFKSWVQILAGLVLRDLPLMDCYIDAITIDNK